MFFGENFFRKLIIRLDDVLRTSKAPVMRAGLYFVLSFWRGRAEDRLIAAANYLKHRPYGIISAWAFRQARRCTAEIALKIEGNSSTTIIHSFVAKQWVSDKEPGIILISFESQLKKVLELASWPELQKKYRICFMPSWQNFFSPEIFRLDFSATAPYFILPSNFDEVELRPLLGPHCRVLPFHAASWVNHELYATEGTHKDVDIVMLANFQRLKRHWKFFEALAEMPNDLVVKIIGIPHGQRTREHILQEADLFGVLNRFEILENVDQATIRDTLCRSRLLVAMTHREGSYIGVAEAIVANTPVAMFSNAMIGTKAYINSKSGFLLEPRSPLAPQLMKALALADEISPREWAIKNISAKINCQKLNELLRQDYIAGGLIWTNDINPFFCVRFDFLEVDKREAIVVEENRLKRMYGLTIAR